MKKVLISVAALFLTALIVYLTLSIELDKSNELKAESSSSESTRSVISDISSYEASSITQSKAETSSKEESSAEDVSKPTTVNSLVGMPEAEPEYIEDVSTSSMLSDAEQEWFDKANLLLEKYDTLKNKTYICCENEKTVNTKAEENKYYKEYSKSGLLLVYGKYIYEGNKKCYLDEYNYYYDNNKNLKCTKYYFKEDYAKERGVWADSTEKYFDKDGLVELKMSRYDKDNLLKLTTYEYDKSGTVIKKYVYAFEIENKDSKENYILKYVNIYDENDSLSENYNY